MALVILVFKPSTLVIVSFCLFINHFIIRTTDYMAFRGDWLELITPALVIIDFD